MSTKISDEILRDMRITFPLQVFEISNELKLRPLSEKDLDRLTVILSGDPEMTWTRREWNRGNIEYLLNLRLDHYAQYGFGVYAIEKEGVLIGMAGPQVWDYCDDAIEVISYVMRDHWNVGLSTSLGRWMLNRLSEITSMDVVHATTRPMNAAAIRLVEKFGFNKVGMVTHHGVDAIHWIKKVRPNAEDIT